MRESPALLEKCRLLMSDGSVCKLMEDGTTRVSCCYCFCSFCCVDVTSGCWCPLVQEILCSILVLSKIRCKTLKPFTNYPAVDLYEFYLYSKMFSSYILTSLVLSAATTVKYLGNLLNASLTACSCIKEDLFESVAFNSAKSFNATSASHTTCDDDAV